MKLIKFSCFLILLFIVLPSLQSCDSNSTSPGGVNTAVWTLGTMNFSSGNTAVEQGTYLHATTETSGSTDGVIVRFSAIPSGESGTYKVVSFNKTTLAADEIAVEVDHGVSDVWLSTGNDNMTATITTYNNKRQISSTNDVSVQHYASNGPQSDSTMASFVVTIP